MTMDIGELLHDTKTGESRFRLVELLERGARYDVAVGEDTHLDAKRLCIKAIRYRDTEDADEVEARRAALYEELGVLTLPLTLLPEPLDWLTVANKGDFGEGRFANDEPMLVYEHQPGATLKAKMASAGGQGIETERALRIVHELATFLAALHGHGHVFRRLNSEHVIIGLDDILHLVGCGNVLPTGQAAGPQRDAPDDPYVAPEVRENDNGKLVAPAADVYSLGALLAFLLSARAPLTVVESPLDPAAYEAVVARGEGMSKLVARMMHPNPRKRFASVDEVLPHLDPHQTPDPNHPALRDVSLPGPYDPDGSYARGGLSAGPLVVAPRVEEDKLPVTVEEAALAVQKRWRVAAVVSGGLAFAAVVWLVLMMVL